MNERIRALTEQAMSDVQEEAYPGERSWGIDDVMEKFAELIVRECAGVVFKKVGPKSALDVLEHFGVE